MTGSKGSRKYTPETLPTAEPARITPDDIEATISEAKAKVCEGADTLQNQSVLTKESSQEAAKQANQVLRAFEETLRKIRLLKQAIVTQQRPLVSPPEPSSKNWINKK